MKDKLIKTLAEAGYKYHPKFPYDYYVREYSVAIYKRVTLHGHHCLSTFEPRFIIITIHDNHDGEGYMFKIARAGLDWIEPVAPDHDTSSVTDTIQVANQLTKRSLG